VVGAGAGAGPGVDTGMRKDRYIRMLRVLVRQGGAWRGRRWRILTSHRRGAGYTEEQLETPKNGEMESIHFNTQEAGKLKEMFMSPPPFDQSWIDQERKDMDNPNIEKDWFDGIAVKKGKEVFETWDVEETELLARRRKSYKDAAPNTERAQLETPHYRGLKEVVTSDEEWKSSDGHQFTVTVYRKPNVDPEFVTVYYHGGGLKIGESNSEAISCRILAQNFNTIVYSVGYRLIFINSAKAGLQDAKDAYEEVKKRHSQKKILIVGVSSGGTLAGLVSQSELERKKWLLGVILRNPVTIAPESEDITITAERKKYYRHMRSTFAQRLVEYYNEDPKNKLPYHLDTVLQLPGFLKRYNDLPRDGFDAMPGEASTDAMKDLPRTWIQVCTNDPLFGDGVDYAGHLQGANVEIMLNVWKGYPHTFFHMAPFMEQSHQAEQDVVAGIKWIKGEKS